MSGYGHRCKHFSLADGWIDYYEISWTFDMKYSGSRLRFPRTMRRDTDIYGAKRFCKKWNIKFPSEDK